MTVNKVLDLKLIFSFIFLLFSHNLFSASCCGGGGGLPGIILNDSKAKLSSSFNYQKVVADIDSEGEGRLRENGQNISKIYGLDGSYLLSDYWQVAMAIPYYQNTVQNASGSESSKHIGDISGTVAFEYLPEINYSRWIPRGLVYSKLTLPTGRSSRESKSTLRSDITGQGHIVLSVGSPFYKIKNNFDYLLVPEIFYKFKTIENENGRDTSYGNAYGYSLLFSVGVSPYGGASRLGIGIRPQYQSQQKITRSEVSTSESKYFTDVSMTYSYAINIAHSISFTYSDQSIIGPAKNSSLVSAFIFNYVVHWPL